MPSQASTPLRLLLLLLGAFVLLGAVGARDLEVRPNARRGRAKAAEPARDFHHPYTGVCFPAELAGMHRRPIDRYDDRGEDVGASYHGKRDGRIMLVVSAYSYPRPAELTSLREVFDDAIIAIRQHNKAARLKSTRAFAADDPDAGLVADFEFRAALFGARAPVKSRLVVLGRGRWLLKYRFTFPAAESKTAETIIRTVVETIGTSPVRL